MKKILIIILVTLLATATGLYFRPSYAMFGQMNWLDVLTKGMTVGSIESVFTQGKLDESFEFVMRFTIAGFVAGVLLAFVAGKSKSKSKSAKSTKPAKPKKK